MAKIISNILKTIIVIKVQITSIVCSKLNKKIAHVEAGLRSENKNMQEEINRILTDNVSSLLFTATKEATQNLLKENFDKKKI